LLCSMRIWQKLQLAGRNDRPFLARRKWMDVDDVNGCGMNSGIHKAHMFRLVLQ
jgi:hypothetical protein